MTLLKTNNIQSIKYYGTLRRSIINLCHSVAIILKNYVMWYKCHMRWHNFHSKRTLITGLGQ